jgi:hypothetical protein
MVCGDEVALHTLRKTVDMDLTMQTRGRESHHLPILFKKSKSGNGTDGPLHEFVNSIGKKRDTGAARSFVSFPMLRFRVS